MIHSRWSFCAGVIAASLIAASGDCEKVTATSTLIYYDSSFSVGIFYAYSASCTISGESFRFHCGRDLGDFR